MTTKRCSSNNTNKLSPQEPLHAAHSALFGSNNTNKLSPQEQLIMFLDLVLRFK